MGTRYLALAGELPSGFCESESESESESEREREMDD